jgi:hypothetical protein
MFSKLCLYVVPWLDGAKQYARAKELTTRLKAMGYEGWTITHSFYAYMNGFTAEDEQGDWRDLDFSCVEDLCEIDTSTIPTIAKILDKSKADTLAKLMVCCQLLFLVPQCIVRARQQMPVSTLEVATVGYAAVSLMAYIYWWKKPYCVHAKTRLYRNRGVPPFPIIQRQLPETLIGQLIRKIESLGPAIDSMRTPVSTVGGFRRNAQQAELLEDARTIVTATETSSSSSSVKMEEKRSTVVYESEVISNETHDNSDYGLDLGRCHVRTKLAAMSYFVLDSSALLTANIVFSLVHVSAWQFHFPTRVEQRLWHVFSLCPIVLIVLLVFVRAVEQAVLGLIYPQRRLSVAFRTMFWIFVLLLSCSRMYLFGEMFVGLRRAVPGIYETVVWTRYLPTVV